MPAIAIIVIIIAVLMVVALVILAIVLPDIHPEWFENKDNDVWPPIGGSI